MAAVFVLWMPFAIQLPGAGLDASWLFGLVMAFNRHLQWGREIVFTFGPYGILDKNQGLVVDPNVWVLTLSFAVAVNLAFALAFAFFLRAFDAHPLTWGLALLVAFLPVPIWELTEIELLLLTIMALTLAVRVDRGGSLFATAGASLVSLQVLSKGTLLISGVSILAGFAVAAWISGRRRLIPWALATLLGSFFVLYEVAGQSLGSLPAYLRTTFELIAGYSPAMSTFADQPASINPGFIRLCALALVPLTAGEVVIAFRRRNRGLLALSLICVPMMFLSFKEGFVRWHLDYFRFIAVLLQLLILVAILAPRRRTTPKPHSRPDMESIMTGAFWRRRLPSLALSFSAVVLLLPIASASLSIPGLNPHWPADTLRGRIRTYEHAAGIMQSSAARELMASQERAAVVNGDPLPRAFLASIGHASVDVMPADIDVIAANDLNWTPRPVLQSYTSYTSYLDDMDASFIRGRSAPEFIIATLREIDGRYQLFDEPATQRALLERYRVDAVDSTWVLLRRASNICPCPMRELGTITAATGEAVTPPSAAPGERVFVRVRLENSLAGRAANLIFDAGAVRIKLTSGGAETPYRLVPGTAGDGLLLSAYVNNLADLATIYAGCDTGAISSIRVEPDNPAMFDSAVRYEFFAERTGSCTPMGRSTQAQRALTPT